MGNGVFGRNGKDQMNMVRACSSLQNPHALPFREPTDNLANLNPDISEKKFFPVLGSNDYVVIAVPHNVVC